MKFKSCKWLTKMLSTTISKDIKNRLKYVPDQDLMRIIKTERELKVAPIRPAIISLGPPGDAFGLSTCTVNGQIFTCFFARFDIGRAG